MLLDDVLLVLIKDSEEYEWIEVICIVAIDRPCLGWESYFVIIHDESF